MKKTLPILSSFAAVLFISCGQSTNENANKAMKADTVKSAVQPTAGETNIIDNEGKKRGHWVVINNTEHLPGYRDNEKIREGDYKEDKKQGVWVDYYPGGGIKSETEYANDSIIKVTNYKEGEKNSL